MSLVVLLNQKHDIEFYLIIKSNLRFSTIKIKPKHTHFRNRLKFEYANQLQYLLVYEVVQKVYCKLCYFEDD